MEKNNKKKTAKKESKESTLPKKEKLTSRQKELIITILVLIFSVAIGFFIGKALFEAMYGKI